MKKYIIARFSETSTWKGFCWVAISFGLDLSPDSVNAITTFGILIVGMIGILLPDKVS